VADDLIAKLDKGAASLLVGVEDGKLDYKERAAIFGVLVRYLQVKNKLNTDEEEGEGGLDDLRKRLKTGASAGAGARRGARKRKPPEAAAHAGGPFWRAAATLSDAAGPDHGEAAIDGGSDGGLHPGPNGHAIGDA